MNGKPQVYMCLVLAALALTACGQSKLPGIVDTPSISISTEGAVDAYQVDVFNKDYYQVSELAAMAVEEASEYNTKHQTGEEAPVRVEKVEGLEDGSGKIVVHSIFQDADTYSDYNEALLFYGTVEEALTAGMDLGAELRDVKEDTLLSEEALTQYARQHIIVTTERVRIYCPYKVTHISEGAVMAEDGSVDASRAGGTVIILMKK